MDLGTIVFNLAKEAKHEAFLIETYEDSGIDQMEKDFDDGADESSWVLVVRDPILIKRLYNGANWTEWDEPMPPTVWTDDFGSLTDVMDWSDTSSFAADKWEELLAYFSGEQEGEEEGEGEEEE